MTAQPDDPFHHLHDENYTAAVSARQATWRDMVFMGGRPVEQFPLNWRFVIDPFDEGLRQKWYAQDALPSSEWQVPRDYDAGDWQMISVPSCWNLLRPEWTYFEGSAWYTQDFEITPGSAGERIVLRIGAANYAARVFLNGTFLAMHRGGSTPFFIELGDDLQAGRNRLQIQVDNRRSSERVPMHHIDWFNYGGIYREIALVRLPRIFIREFHAGLVPGTINRIRIELSLSEACDGMATIDFPDLLTETITVERGRALHEFDVSPDLWSPGDPRLYDVTVRCAGDTIVDRIGFRTIAVVDGEIVLNGKPLFLKGICVHEDDIRLGKCTNDDDIRRRFAHAKELGCNILRLSHYPHHERVAEIADEVGLLLWEEIPVYWAIDFENPDTYADAENQLLELIRRDRNRASVVIWGVGNENADTDARYHFMRRLAETARQSDGTRLVSAACLINREHFRIEDRLAQHLDIIGLNEYFGWYEPSFDGLRRLLANSHPDRPVVISETGADALAGHHGTEDELFTEERQASMLVSQADITMNCAYIKGFFPWLLYDFRSERRQTSFQRGFNRKGLIAEDKDTRKIAFGAMASIFKTRDSM